MPGSARLQILVDGSDMKVEDKDLISFAYYETMEGCARYKLECNTPDWDRWDKYLTNPDSVMQIRFGYKYDTGAQKWSEWKYVDCSRARPVYYINAVSITMEGMCSGYKLNESTAEETRTYRDKKISEIVEEIAKRNDLKSRVKATKGKFLLHQCHLSDAHFIQGVLLSKAISTDGRVDFYFWIENGKTLVFEPPNIGSSGRKYIMQQDPTKTNPDQHIEYLDVEYRRGFLAPENSGVIEVIGYDPLKKKIYTERIDDNKVQFPKLASRKPTPTKRPSRIFPVTEPGPEKYDKEDVKNSGMSIWGRNSRKLYRVTLEVPPDPTVAVAKVTTLDITDQRGRPHYTTGRYLTYAAYTVMDKGGYRTILFLERRCSEKGG